MIDARVTLRDGVLVAASLWGVQGAAKPALVIRTPYGRRRFDTYPWARRLVEAGYALVAVDVRGRGDSEGRWRAMVGDGTDGYDVIEWVADQPWCDGNVGTIGGSYDAMTQWWAAVTQPPSLRCIVPMCVSAQLQDTQPFGHSNGVLMTYFLWWLTQLDAVQADVDWSAVLQAQPHDMADLVGVDREAWHDYVGGKAGYGEQGWAVDPRDVHVPALITTGHWDDTRTFNWWTQLTASPAAQHHQLLVGAWDHPGNGGPRPTLGGVDVSAVLIDPVEHWLTFLDRWMRPGLQPDTQPAVTVCRTGSWCWETHATWPSTAGTSVHELGGGGWTHDPRDPLVPGGSGDGALADPPLDPAHLEARADVLTLDLPVERSALLLSGFPRVELDVEQEAGGTVVCWLTDLAPDGTGLRLGIWPAAAPHPGGGAATLTFELAAIHHEVKAGHRLRLAVGSSFAPVYAHAVEPTAVTLTASRLILPNG